MKLNNQDMTMIRGDTESIEIVRKKDGEPYPFEIGDTLYFTVKTSCYATDTLLQKTVTEFDGARAVIPIDHGDTAELCPGDYRYDLQHTDAAGNVKTLLGPAQFKLKGDITHG